jgi:predicted Zn-dependent peptidase
MPLPHTVHEIKLKNGARGVLIDVPNTTAVSYEFNFRAGNDYVKNKEIHQVAHLLEHLACGANEKFSTAEAFSQEFEHNGAFSNAVTNDTDITYYGTSALMELYRILDLWQLSITKPHFTSEALEFEKSTVREEIEGQLTDPERVLAQRIVRATGGTSLLDAEELDSIDAVTLDDIVEHYQRTHTLTNMRFMIAGALTDKEQTIIDRLEQWELPSGSGLLPIPKGIVHQGECFSIRRADMASLFFNISFVLGRELTNRERDAMNVLNYILSGTFHSRIYGKARASGLCYAIGVTTVSYHNHTAEWTIAGHVSQRNASALYELIVQEFRAIIADGVADEELAEAKSSALGKVQLRGQTPEALGEEYDDYVFNDEPIEYLWDAPQYIALVNKADISRLAGEFIATGLWAFGEIGAVTSSETLARQKILAQIIQPEVE